MDLTQALSIDCEMVGIGPRGFRVDMLARVSIVNEYSQCVYDRFVYPRERVTDYRTRISGVRKQDIMHGQKFPVVREEVRSMIKGRWLVGHSLHHDLRALQLSHPEFRTRDTAMYPPFIKMNKNRTPSLRWLARQILGRNIQGGEHSSVEDAKACMAIYKTVERDWEEMSDDSDDDDSSSDEEYRYHYHF